MAAVEEASDKQGPPAKVAVKRRHGKTPGLIKRGNVYHCDFMFRGQRVQKKLSGDKAAAERMLRAERARLDLGAAGIIDQARGYAEIKKLYLEHAKQSLRSWKTYEADLRRIETIESFQTIEQITPAFVTRYRARRLLDGVSKRSINREISALSAMLSWAVKIREIGFNPIAGIPALENDEPRKVRRSLTLDEANRLLTEASPRLRPMFLLMLSTGMRRSEAVELRFNDIDWVNGVITVTPKNAKSRKRRIFPVTSWLLEALTALRNDAASREPVPHPNAMQSAKQAASFSRDHVFVTPVNTPWRNNLLRRFRDTCQRAGIADGFDPAEARSKSARRKRDEALEGRKRARKHLAVDIHSLRKTFTSDSLRNRGNAKAVQAILGHSTLELTMNTYAETNLDDLRAVINALPYGKPALAD